MRKKIKSYIPFISFSVLSLSAQGLVFIFNILVANKLPVETFGRYSLIISIVNLLLLLSCQWHTSMMQYCGSIEYSKNGNIRETNQVRNLLFAICYGLVVIFVFIFRGKLKQYVGGDYLMIILTLVFVKGLQELFSSYLIASGKRQISALNLLAIQVVNIFFVVLLKGDMGIIMTVQILANILCIQMMPYVNLKDFIPKRIDGEAFKICMNFALWQLMGSLAIYIISYGDNYIIKIFLSNSDIAVYNAAYKIFNAVFLASNIIATYYISPLARALKNKENKTIKNIFWNERLVIFGLCVILHIGLIVFAPQLFDVLYKGKYYESISIFRILMISSVLRYWIVFEMLYFNSVGRIRVQQILNVISALLKVGLSFIFIYFFGLIGIAFATLVSNSIMGIASFCLSEKEIWGLSNS